MRVPTIAIIGGLIVSGFSMVAHAAWPERPITFVVPYAAGAANDNSARITAQWLGKVLKQTIIVENRTGANGAMAAEFVARAPADGYTLFMSASPTLVIVPHMQKVGYDPFKSFVLISIVDTTAIAFAVHPNVPVKSFSELVAYAKLRPNKLDYATGATGSTGHLSMALLLKRTGLTMTHVPYKSGGQALVAVLGAHVPIYVGTVSDPMPHIKSGKLKVLGVSSDKRLSQLPEVPTIAEQGYPGYSTATWNGLLAPAGTPKEVISMIGDELRPACKDSGFNATFNVLNVDTLCTTREQSSERLQADWALWKEAVKALGMALD